MFKTVSIAVASSVATALLLGIAFASPGQQARGRVDNINVKLEWVRENPKVSESLTISVDNGRQGNVTRPSSDGRGIRQVMVTPTLNDNRTVTLNVHIQSTASPSESLDTVITVPDGETKVISAASTKGDAKAVKTGEELVFITPNVG